jgi:hypothetical protein
MASAEEGSMATASDPSAGGLPADVPPEDLAPRRSDRSPWNWLLILPIVVPLLVPLYNHRDPELGGWPFFYWFQLALVALGVICTSIVYLATRRSRGERAAASRAARGEGV